MGKYNANGSICKMKGRFSDYQHFQYRSYPSPSQYDLQLVYRQAFAGLSASVAAFVPPTSF